MNSRFACFTEEQQNLFDTLGKKEQQYVIFRSQGMGKVDAHKAAGYTGKNHAQNASLLESRDKPFIKDLINIMSGQSNALLALKENSKISKEINKKIEEENLTPEQIEFAMSVPKQSTFIAQEDFDTSKITAEKARNIQFFRDIANGKIKTVKTTFTYGYNEEGKRVKTGEKVEEIADVTQRINAQKEVMRLVGIADVLQLSQVNAKNVNIMIVDASNKRINDELKEEIKEE